MTTQEQIAAAIDGGQDLAGYSGTPDYQHVYYETNGQPYWKKVGGGKLYIPPATAMTMFDDPKSMAWARTQGYDIDGGKEGLEASQQSYVDDKGYTRMPDSPVHGSRPSGGLFHESGTWNGESGGWDQSLDWGNILTMVVAGVMTAGVATAIMGGGAAAESAVSTAIATGSPEAGMAAAGGAGVGIGETAAVTGGLASGAGLPGAVGLGAGLDAAAGIGGAAGVAGATSGVGPLAGGLTGATTESTVPSALAMNGIEGVTQTAGIGTLPNVASSGGVQSALAGGGATGAGTMSKVAEMLRTGGNAVGAATNAAGNNRLAQNDPYLKRSQQEMKERNNALADVYRNNWYNTRQKGPFDPKPLQQMSPEFMASLKDLSTQGQAKLKTAPAYDTSKIPTLDPSAMEQIGSWVGPALTTAGVISQFL